jgi:hypothetical protein
MEVHLAPSGPQGHSTRGPLQDQRDRRQVRRARPTMKTLKRPPTAVMHRPTTQPLTRPRVPEQAPLALGEPMRLEPLPWKSWAENGLLLLTLSITRLAGR